MKTKKKEREKTKEEKRKYKKYKKKEKQIKISSPSSDFTQSPRGPGASPFFFYIHRKGVHKHKWENFKTAYPKLG